MNDMTKVIVPKSDQINADDLIGGPITITIRDVQIRGGQEQPVSIYFEGSDKAFRPCKSMSRVLVAAWGADAREYVGRSLTVYRDATVKWAGMEVGGIRISHLSHIDNTMTLALTATKGSRKPHVVKPLANMPAAQAASSSVDKAAQWAATFVAELGRTDDPAALQAKHKKTLDKLQAERPDLWKDVEHVFDAVAADVSDDPFAEGPADDQRGEANAFDADQIIGFINAKVRETDVISLVSSHADTIAGFSEDDRARVAEAQAARIEEIKGAGE